MKILLVTLSMLTAATTLSFHKECFVQPTLETEFQWIGSHIDITCWVPEEEEANKSGPNHHLRDYSLPVLSLTIRFSDKIGDKDYDKITIHRSVVYVTRYRNEQANDTVVNVTLPIGHGWIDFNFTAEGQFELWHKPSSIRLASLSQMTNIKRVFVTGSNVTINCHHLDIGWTIINGETVTIPLSSDEEDHNFSFFSNDPIKPMIKIGKDILHVGWDGVALSDITTLKLEYQKPLPPSIQHGFTVSCTKNKRMCTVKGRRVVKTIAFSNTENLPSSLSVTADKETFVYFHRPSPHLPSTVTPLGSVPNDAIDKGSAGYIVAIVILAIICVGLVVGIGLLARRHLGLSMNGIMEEQIRNTVKDVIEQEAKPLMASYSYLSSVSSGEHHHEPRMWNAVVENDARYMEFLIGLGMNPENQEKGHSTTPFVEAHVLGRNDILQVIAHNKGETLTIPSNELIIKVGNELTKRIKSVFKSATYGMYEQERGVKLLLISYSLPGTIRDNEGRSLLHYMASKSFMDGRPAWEASDIEEFFNNHEYFINAIDHWGNTPLHILAMRHREEEKKVYWNSEEQTLSQAWLALAEFFLSHGCDPRIPNHQGLLPHQVAIDKGNHDLAKIFQRKYDILGPVDFEESFKEYENFVKAAQHGETSQIRKHLLNHVPLLPTCGHLDPLVEAVRHRQRDAVFLLLCAGVPLCNRSIEDLTPIETAHNTLGAPACFPALMRKAYRDRLVCEISRVSEKDESFKLLREGMQHMLKQIQDNGSDSKWKFTSANHAESSKEARHLLVQASELGLSLTCQLLGLEDVYLHPLPNEVKPFERAFSNKRVDTQYALYRDLKMSPFTYPSSGLKTLCPRLAAHFWLSDLKLLQEICSDDENLSLCGETKMQIGQFIDKLKDYGKTIRGDVADDSIPDPPLMLLYFLVKHGLDTILQTLLSTCKYLNINTVVQPFSKSTLLHIASMQGHLDLIELLIYYGANLNLTTIGGYTAAHLAALRGHKECMIYILTHMKNQAKDTDVKCRLRLTAFELMDNYEAYCKKTLHPLLSHMDALHIRNRRGPGNQAYELLKRKSKLLNISDAESLLKCSAEKNKNKADGERIQGEVQLITKCICKQIEDLRYQGEVKSVGHIFEGNGMFDITESRVIYELTQFHAVGTSATITCRDVVNSNNHTSVEIVSERHQELFLGVTFRETFCNLIENIVAKDEDIAPGVALAPPFVTKFAEGIELYTVWTKENEFRFMRTEIVPCLRAERPHDSRLQTLPENFHHYMGEDCVHLQLKNAEGEWLYRGFNCENYIWGNLDKNKKTVWLTCRLIQLLLRSSWWAPQFNTKRYEKPWHTMSLGVKQLADRVIRTLFLEEIVECEDWIESELFEKVYAIFERAAQKDEHGNWIAKKSVNSFVTPRHYSCSVATSIIGIMKFLDDLMKIQNSTPTTQPKVEETPSKVSFADGLP